MCMQCISKHYCRDILKVLDGLWDKHEHFRVWDQKVIGDSHDGITYAGKVTYMAYYHVIL